MTHGHGDHAGSIDELKRKLGDSVPVMMPELDARIHAGEKVVEGKLPASGRSSRPAPTSAWRPAIGWAASR